MKKTITILSLALLFLAGNLFAQDNRGSKKQNRKGNTNQVRFVDENGDGYNDNAPDHDGDKIPNGMDEDYKGAKNRKGNTRGFVDENGDGINDNALDADGDGIPNGRDGDFVRTQDGSGNRRGSGDSDGTRGNRRGGKR